MSHQSSNVGRCSLMLYNHEKTQFIRKIFARVPCPSLSFDVYSNSCPLSWWCHPNISSSTAPFSYCPQSFPTWGSFPINQLFTSGGQSIRTFCGVTFSFRLTECININIFEFVFSFEISRHLVSHCFLIHPLKLTNFFIHPWFSFIHT